DLNATKKKSPSGPEPARVLCPTHTGSNMSLSMPLSRAARPISSTLHTPCSASAYSLRSTSGRSGRASGTTVVLVLAPSCATSVVDNTDGGRAATIQGSSGSPITTVHPASADFGMLYGSEPRSRTTVDTSPLTAAAVRIGKIDALSDARTYDGSRSRIG